MIKINILNNYKNNNEQSILDEYNNKIKELEDKKDKEIFNLKLNCFNNKKFRNDIINHYKQNIDILCCDIMIINHIKYFYSHQQDYSTILIGYDYQNAENNNFLYREEYTEDFDFISDNIQDIVDDIYDEWEYIDFFENINNNIYKDLIYNVFIPKNTFCVSEYDFYIKKVFYPLILELEKLINSEKEKLIELILEYYALNYS